MRARARSKSAFANWTIQRVYRSELDAFGRTQVLEQRPVGCRETPAAKPGVRDDQTIERIPRPGFFGGEREPVNRRRIVDDPSVVGDDRMNAAARLEADTS